MKKIIEDLELLENQMYAVNSQIISLRWIGMKEIPTEEQIKTLNSGIGGWIKTIRKIREGIINENTRNIL